MRIEKTMHKKRSDINLKKNNFETVSRVTTEPILPPGNDLILIRGTLLVFDRSLAVGNFSFHNYMTDEEREIMINEKKRENKQIHDENKSLNYNQIAELNGLRKEAQLQVYSPGRESLGHFIFKAKISGYEDFDIRGWIGITPAKIGDEVEMVVEWRDDHYEIYALLLPNEKIISIYPQCIRGSKAFNVYELKLSFVESSIWVIGMSVVMFLTLLITKDFKLNEFFGMMKYFYGFFLIVYLYLHLRWRIKWLNTSVSAAERIFKTIGWDAVEYIDLEKKTYHKIRRLKTKREHKKPNKFNEPVIEFFESKNSMFYY